MISLICAVIVRKSLIDFVLATLVESKPNMRPTVSHEHPYICVGREKSDEAAPSQTFHPVVTHVLQVVLLRPPLPCPNDRC